MGRKKKSANKSPGVESSKSQKKQIRKSKVAVDALQKFLMENENTKNQLSIDLLISLDRLMNKIIEVQGDEAWGNRIPFTTDLTCLLDWLKSEGVYDEDTASFAVSKTGGDEGNGIFAKKDFKVY